MIDALSANRFLRALIPDEDDHPVYQTFDDDKDRKSKELIRKLEGGRTLNGNVLVTLTNLNNHGAGIFVQVNAGGRGKANVTAVRAVFVDHDDPSRELDFSRCPPSIIVQSSPGKIQAYWLLDGIVPVKEFGKAQKHLAAALNTDKSVHNSDRVMRLPGSWHKKDPANPFLVKLLKCDGDLRYNLGAVLDAFPVPVGYIEPPDAEKEPNENSDLTEEANASLRRVLAWLDRQKIRYTQKSSQPTKIVLDKCVFNPDHRGEHGMAIKIAPGGGIWAGCWHNSCGGNVQRWKEVRALVGGWSGRFYGFDRGDHAEMARRALTDLKGDVEEDCIYADRLFRYAPERFIWEGVSDEEQDRQILSYSGLPKGLTGRMALKWPDVTGTRKALGQLASRPGFFAEAPRGIMFRNGFLRVDGQELKLEPPSAGQRQRETLSFDYEANAPAERWALFLREIFAPDEDVEQKIALLQEFAGAALIGIAPRMQRALLLLGDGQNGKSVFLKCLTALFPPRFVAAVHPQVWGNEYYRAMLAGTRLNVVSELPESDILESGAFKAMVDGSEMNARFIRQAAFTFVPEAAHLFSANQLPGTTDYSHGFWRRFLVVRFNRIFTDAEANTTLAAELIENELPGICAWVLRGAARLLQRDRYSIPASSQEALEEWKAGADAVAAFLDDCTEPAPLSEMLGIQARELYALFRTWLAENGHRIMSAQKFGRRLRFLKVFPVKSDGLLYYPLTVSYEPSISY